MYEHFTYEVTLKIKKYPNESAFKVKISGNRGDIERNLGHIERRYVVLKKELKSKKWN